MDDMKISIIVPVYNTEEYLAECLNSLLNQTLNEIEIICVNDGSTDNSLEILNTFSKKFSNIIVFTKDNEGSGSARNLGLKHAKGEYIAFLDSDDFILNDNALNYLYECAIEENVDMVSANLQSFNGKTVVKETPYLKPITEKTIKKSEDYGIPWFFPKNIFKASLLKEHDIFFPKLKRGQDPVFLSTVLTNIQYYLEVPIDYYSYRSPTVSKINSFEKYIDYFRGIYQVFKIITTQDRFNKMVESFLLELYRMKNRDILISNKEELKEVILVMDEIYELFIHWGDEEILKKIHMSFNEWLSKVNLEELDIFVYEPNNIKAKYSNSVFMVNYRKDHTPDKPLVSVIIPVYNVEKYFGVCMHSVLSQTLENIEIICIDDCSSDDSSKLLEYYALKDKRVKILRNEYNSSLGFSRNAGMKHSKGKYIFFLDSDDWINRDALEILYKEAELYNLELLFFKLINFDDDKRMFYTTDYYDMEFLDKFEHVIFNHLDLEPEEVFEMTESACSKLYLKSFLDELNFQFPVRLIHEDNPSFLEIITSAKKVSIINKYLFNRRRRLGSITQFKGKDILDIIIILEKMFKIIYNNPELYKRYNNVLLNRIIFMLKIKYRLIETEFKDEFLKQSKILINKFIIEYNIKEDFNKYLNDANKDFYHIILNSN